MDEARKELARQPRLEGYVADIPCVDVAIDLVRQRIGDVSLETRRAREFRPRLIQSIGGNERRHPLEASAGRKSVGLISPENFVSVQPQIALPRVVQQRIELGLRQSPAFGQQCLEQAQLPEPKASDSASP